MKIYEFADFECPACEAARYQIRDLVRQKRVSLTLVPYVIASHKGSKIKALAYLASAKTAAKDRVAECLWNASSDESQIVRSCALASETDPRALLDTMWSQKSRRLLASCVEMAVKAGVHEVPTFVVRTPDGRWTVTNGAESVAMLAQGRMATTQEPPLKTP